MIQNTECPFTDAYKAHKLITSRLPKEIYESKNLLLKPVPISSEVWQSNHEPWEKILVTYSTVDQAKNTTESWMMMRDLEDQATKILTTM